MGFKMDNTIMTIIYFLGALVPLIGVIIKLNSTITKLNVTISVLNEQMKYSQSDRKEIHAQLNDHEKRITVLEKVRK